MEKLTHYSCTDRIGEYDITTIEDKYSTLCLILVDGKFNYKFVYEFLKNFDTFELYNNGELNIKLSSWLLENIPYYFS